MRPLRFRRLYPRREGHADDCDLATVRRARLRPSTRSAAPGRAAAATRAVGHRRAADVTCVSRAAARRVAAVRTLGVDARRAARRAGGDPVGGRARVGRALPPSGVSWGTLEPSRLAGG